MQPFLAEEVVIVVCGEVVFGSGLAAERIAVAQFLDVVEPAGDSLVAVAVKSEEVHAGTGVYTAVNLRTL